MAKANAPAHGVPPVDELPPSLVWWPVPAHEPPCSEVALEARALRLERCAPVATVFGLKRRTACLSHVAHPRLMPTPGRFSPGRCSAGYCVRRPRAPGHDARVHRGRGACDTVVRPLGDAPFDRPPARSHRLPAPSVRHRGVAHRDAEAGPVRLVRPVPRAPTHARRLGAVRLRDPSLVRPKLIAVHSTLAGARSPHTRRPTGCAQRCRTRPASRVKRSRRGRAIARRNYLLESWKISLVNAAAKSFTFVFCVAKDEQ
ncbi:hypothetical protein PSP31121_05507 [Pandoraea sputorum]|uniref:Uncharacterized protein n=1 Tax=Pandoraea sputorum TaxID=93222 RepID=A0A5E5BJJ3_9BURK|nr:hypothetical protein PSP31121_05507 [Pandoraea sputorum]